MAHFDRTDARFAPRTPNRIGALSRLAVWARAWRELRKMQRLDAAALRDMGLPADAAARTSLRDIAERMAAGR
jgi:hypothetical protein